MCPLKSVSSSIFEFVFQDGDNVFVIGVSKRMEWLLELMGHIRNVAYGAKSVTCGDIKLVCFMFMLLLVVYFPQSTIYKIYKTEQPRT